MSLWLYYLLAVLLFLNNLTGFALNFASLPGNLLIIGGTTIFCWFAKTPHHSVSWYTIGFLCLFAVLAEAIEFFAGTAGAAKYNASRRALALSVVGSVIGSITGAVIGVPLPVVGPAVGALLGGALGAASGAAIGEDWKGSDLDLSLRVGAAAFWGRILGTVSKLAIGAIMLVVATVDSFW
jgi:uncharacterized protein YqgC (DUF456 family)